MSGDNIADLIRNNIELAFSKAREIGEIIGVVSRRIPSKVQRDNYLVYIEVNPEVYYSLGDKLSIGNYLATVDIRTLKTVGLRITAIDRYDAITDLQISPALNLEPDPEGLLVNAVIEASPLLTEKGEPFGSAIEPQSPVVIPSDSTLLTKLIGVPEEGITVGYLHTGVTAVGDGNVPLKLPQVEFFKHILIIGTTGSGKTTFVKNLLFSIMKSWKNTMLIAIDAAGDYTQIIVPPPKLPKDSKVFIHSEDEFIKEYPKSITVLVPSRKGDSVVDKFSYRYVTERLMNIVRYFHNANLRIEINDKRILSDGSVMIGLNVRVNNYEACINVIPISLSYTRLKDHLEIFPLFSRQAKVFLKNVIGYLESVVGGIMNFTHLYKVFQERSDEIMRTLKIHRGTMENIERALNFIASSEEVDVMVNFNNSRIPLSIPKADELARNYSGPIILDLDYASQRGAHFLILNMIAYEFLRELYAWKKSGNASKPVIVVLDEAHRFFPSEGTSSEEVELLADFISRVARLGRSRGLGLIFSTHSPKDVHKIVIQLANTKVVFRSEREYLEFLDVPREFIPILELAQDRVALLRTAAIRSGFSIFRTSEPLLGHYDIGRLIAGSWR